MKNLILFLTLGFWCLQAEAQNCVNPVSLEDMIQCGLETDISGSLESPGESYCDMHDCTTGELLIGARSRNPGGMPGLSSLFSERGANCTNFIRSDGSFGPWGDTVHSAISNPNYRARFLNQNLPHITSACPNWRSLNDDQKMHFWVWTFAAIAWDEATCRENARNPRGSDGVAVGLLQMNELRSQRSWRGPNCRVPSVSDATNNLRCGVDIMAELLLGQQGEYRGAGAIYNPNGRNTSYWEKLRRANGSTIGERMRSHPLCR
jgi:hypothetical protein